MGALGAAALQLRLEQQQHWRQARAVNDGTQPGIDPDAHALRELRSGERLYEGEVGWFVKRLVDGSWRIENSY